MIRIDIVPKDCPKDKEQKQKTLYLAVVKMMEEYLASDDDRIAVGLSIIGTELSNVAPNLRGSYYSNIGLRLKLALEIVERDEKERGM